MPQQAHGGNLAWAAALAGCPPDAIVDFSASISPLGPPDSVIAAIVSQLGNLRHYPDPEYSELRLALGHFHQVPSEWILPGNGSAELLTLIGRELAQLAATMLITPAFGDYYRTLTAYNAKVLEFPVDLKIGNRREKVESRMLFSPSPNCGLLLNNPHNPTGKLFSRASILPYLEEFALVVVDEAFMDFLPPDEEQSLIGLVQEYENLVILRSLTKFYSLPGLRLGYAIAHPHRLAKWQSWRDPWPVNTLAASAAIAALQDTEFQQHTWKWLPQARNQLFQGLASMTGLQPLEGAVNYLLVESQQSTSQLQKKLLQQYQILIRDCLSFKELGDRYFRISIRSEADNQRLLTALESVIRNS
ncbi:threonine-phosphate decarboxylase [Anabaena cylindrica FACHB-243]|uniref:threonine-phosphate decarboxylase n=1 Tax=Anabaena cylindrica (strain ATCC 27899 / PCC 7122) TaxID=272123 RepID=K9ZE95_ANACC|nr:MULTISPECIES: threonine-phosphate decarboxylase CobD [Anabaena]AFZ57533.1 L-threonine O-3-phosphate decarboxylase [Anabaena cylindrica PCC 7122]MBD2418470.1 threonine-phosphate decarboxylase [Anabaena cylindrica FACHB-243]MBY5283681.1 threonine-phosphate decarboxylase [Anabaena sp. CCAP 1446/1C]MBY5308457.1 threonine-phosphate decarboxylase [Anabaena sp. CCAP 1446/1C]MCM2405103.1 threonine-phosphate decarboxylase CobD [Anabaena sp. CCAP 1446/1C]